MPPVYYNDTDPFACEWTRSLIAAGLVPPGYVDSRPIQEVRADDIKGFTQCHFFNGISGWAEALRLAGWPDDRSIWTGSCPCQPFSSAGKRKGHADERHLWPEMFRLVRECRPEVVVGEQVASAEVVGTELETAFAVAVQDGRYARANKIAKRLVASRGFGYDQRWLSRVRGDLEGLGYAVRWMVLGAHSVGAPHRRQRLYWVADRHGDGCDSRGGPANGGAGDGWRPVVFSADCDPDGDGLCPHCGIDYGDCPCIGPTEDECEYVERNGVLYGRRLGFPGLAGPQGHAGHGDDGNEPGRLDSLAAGPVAAAGAWGDFRLVACREPDGGAKWRRTSSQPGDEPLAHGIPSSLGRGEPRLAGVARSARANRVGRLRGYGNAIVPQVAAVFLRAVMEPTKETDHA